MKTAILAIVICCAAVPASAQTQNDKCFFLCAPTFKVEPTITWENLIKRPQTATIDDDGKTLVEELERERVFETVFALDIPTTVPRVSFTFETIVKPFVKGASPELETELNLHWLPSDDTGGWVGSHFDIVDKYSPGARPDMLDLYTHKLNFEL